MTKMLELSTRMIYVFLPIWILIVWRYLDIIAHRLYLCDYTTGLFVLNAIGLYFFLRNIKIDVEVYWSVKYE